MKLIVYRQNSLQNEGREIVDLVDPKNDDYDPAKYEFEEFYPQKYSFEEIIQVVDDLFNILMVDSRDDVKGLLIELLINRSEVE